MATHNMFLLKEHTRRLRVLAQEDGIGFMARSGMIVGNRTSR